MEQVPEDLDLHRGPWMTTSLGGKFYPMSPDPLDIHIEDIANGLASERRYNGQGKIDVSYTVAEHSELMSRYAWGRNRLKPALAMAVLMHDAAEAYLRDLNRAAKLSMRMISAQHAPVRNPPLTEVLSPYDEVTSRVDYAIAKRFNLVEAMRDHYEYTKELDIRIVMDEKPAVLNHPQQVWAVDKFEPLGIHLPCRQPPEAMQSFLAWFHYLQSERGFEPR